MKNFGFLIFLLILLPGLVSSQSVIQVAAGDDQIENAIFQAQPGDTIELITDGGIYHETFPIVIDKPLTIRAAPGLTSKPVLSSDDGDHIIEIWDDLTLDGVILNGALGDSLTAKGIRTGDSINVKWGYNLKINNSEFLNFDNQVNDGHAIYADTDTQADSVVITNSFFAHIRQEAIYFKNGKYAPGSVRNFKMEYTTIWDTGDEGIYVEDHDNDINTPGPNFYVNHVTIHNASKVDKDIYPKYIDGAIVKNTIITQSEPTDATPVRIYGPNSVAQNILIYNTKNYISVLSGATVDSTKLLIGQKPYYKDAENGDFALAANSPAALFADDGTALGDTNNGTWDAAEITRWEIVENQDWGRLIKNAVTEGDTIMFVTDGGIYHAPGSVNLKSVPQVLMAKPGLSKKPTLTADFGAPGGSRILKIYASLTIKGLRIQGDGIVDGGTAYGIRWNAGGEDFGNVVVEDCEFVGFRLRALHMDKNNYTDTLIVNNTIFREIGETGVYGKDAARNVGVAKITNSTFYKVGQKGIYLTNVGDLEISHNTFCINDSTVSGRTGNRGVYAKNDTVIVIRNNIFAYQDLYGVVVYGPSPTIEYNLFWQSDTLIKSDHPELTFPIFNDEGDPMFKDTSSANLDLAIEENSLAYQGASDGTNLGDPRWGSYSLLAIDEDAKIPFKFALYQNYPNPFNPITTIRFGLNETSHVTLKIYNLLGEEVTTLVDKQINPGIHSVDFDASGLPSGIYFYRLQANNRVKVRKMLLVK